MSENHLLHLEDLSEGQVIELGTVMLSIDGIVTFAFDPQHVSLG